ncbi:MAG: class I SAM-dependent methyltransferase [Candidatus Omnitrophica bacterium]|nr:class I SAM-dependent methyltransferase [Candidatus Omnitrophota bacterium]MDD5660347.1 class I SAM-dependent methyltransferase [Candidatus Omnitrophota bacterium]
MDNENLQLLICPACGGDLIDSAVYYSCCRCSSIYPVRGGIARFSSGATHDNFAIQWKKFADVQLDSKNGTTCSRDRLLDQSEMLPEEFKGKNVLEVGCGAGRFTEVLLSFGAKVISVDYSAAVEVCAEFNQSFRRKGQLFNTQADVFSLPFKKRSFDIVVGLGMLQHTGNAKKALQCLWEYVRPGGVLLVDRYQISLRSAHILKYCIRPFSRLFSPLATLKMAEVVCAFSIPVQHFLLSRFQGQGFKKYFRFIINRSLNSTFPLNLEIEGKLDADTAYRWSVLDTFDMWAPKYDEPAAFSVWKKDLFNLPDGYVVVCKGCGQGNAGVIKRKA